MSHGHHHNPALATIALFKLAKAVLMVGAGVAAWRLMDPAVEAALKLWAHTVTFGFSEHVIRDVLARVSGLPAQRWKEIGAVSFFYAGVYVVEGVGLWLERTWAEYLTIIMSSLFVPFEVIEVARRGGPLRLAVLAGNLLIVGYLVWHVRRSRRRREGMAQ